MKLPYIIPQKSASETNRVSLNRPVESSTEKQQEHIAMKTYTAVVEKDKDTGLFVGYVPGFPGAHSQGETLEEVRVNLQEVIEMLLDEEPRVEADFVGTQQIVVA